MSFGIILGIIALGCIMIFAACLQATGDAESKAEYTADGRRIVTVTVPTETAARALTVSQAQAAIDYYEVVFKNGTEYYVGSATKSNPLTVRLPEGTYSAALLAGVRSSKVLLAAGYLAGPTISATTTNTVAFTLTAITSSISSLVFTPSITLNTTQDGYPYCSVPTGTTTNTFTFTGILSTIVVATGATVDFRGIVSTSSGGVAPAPVTVPSVTGTLVPATGVVSFSFTAPAAGLASLYFDIPFYPFSESDTGAQKASRWHIKNGLDNYFLDNGTGSGGGILLSFGGVIPVDVTITPPTSP